MNIDGIILVNKPRGVSPADCNRKVQKAFDTKRVSGMDLLENRAEGVLPIFTGKATKILRLFKGRDREYLCEVTLGYSTTTEDISGAVVEQKEIKRKPGVKRTKDILATMLGEHTQIAPMYSAVSYEGKKLHKYREEGIEIPLEKRPARHIEVLDIALKSEIIRTEADLVTFDVYVKCTEGTFIRSLMAEIGQKLGYPAHLSRLKRLSVGTFDIEAAADYETFDMRLNILASGGKGGLSFSNKKDQNWFIPYERVIAPFEHIKLDEELEQKARKGKKIPSEMFGFKKEKTEPFIVTSSSGELLAIYRFNEEFGDYRTLGVLDVE